jgi:tRNA-specific 2-thiouridylase
MAGGTLRGLAKIRQNHKPVPCAVTCRAGAGGGVAAEFDIAQRAVAPGQSFVLYSADGLVLGGGTIDAAVPAE